MYRVCLLVLWLTWVTAGSGDNQISDFQRQKLMIFFSMLDRNNDGVLGEEDYHQAADDVYDECTCLSLNDVTNRQATIVTKAWRVFPFDKEGQGKAVDRDEYFAVMPSRVKDPNYQVNLKAMTEMSFHVLDVDRDNLLSLDEYSDTLHGLRGVNPSTAKRCLDGIDTNHDNILQANEYLSALMDFFVGEDETKPSKWVLGPLY